MHKIKIYLTTLLALFMFFLVGCSNQLLIDRDNEESVIQFIQWVLPIACHDDFGKTESVFITETNELTGKTQDVEINKYYKNSKLHIRVIKHSGSSNSKFDELLYSRPYKDVCK